MGEQVVARLNGGVAQLGEHLPCKQGVKSSNLSISIRPEVKLQRKAGKRMVMMYLENRIPINLISNNDKTSEGYLGKLRYTEKEKQE